MTRKPLLFFCFIICLTLMPGLSNWGQATYVTVRYKIVAPSGTSLSNVTGKALLTYDPTTTPAHAAIEVDGTWSASTNYLTWILPLGGYAYITVPLKKLAGNYEIVIDSTVGTTHYMELNNHIPAQSAPAPTWSRLMWACTQQPECDIVSDYDIDCVDGRFSGDVAITGAVSASNLSGTNTGDETTSTIKTKLGAASGAADGYLTSADWTTFNNKLGAESDTLDSVCERGNTTDKDITSTGTVTGNGLAVTTGAITSAVAAGGTLFNFSNSTPTFSSGTFFSLEPDRSIILDVDYLGTTNHRALGTPNIVLWNSSETGTLDFLCASNRYTHQLSGSPDAADDARYYLPADEPTGESLLTMGADGKMDYTATNTYEPALTKGHLTEATSSVLTISGGSSAVIGAGTSIQVKQASGSQAGYLSAADWNTFNNKVGAEVDGVIGNEVTDATDATLTRSGAGTAVSPYTLGLSSTSPANHLTHYNPDAPRPYGWPQTAANTNIDNEFNGESLADWGWYSAAPTYLLAGTPNQTKYPGRLFISKDSSTNAMSLGYYYKTLGTPLPDAASMSTNDYQRIVIKTSPPNFGSSLALALLDSAGTGYCIHLYGNGNVTYTYKGAITTWGALSTTTTLTNSENYNYLMVQRRKAGDGHAYISYGLSVDGISWSDATTETETLDNAVAYIALGVSFNARTAPVPGTVAIDYIRGETLP